jgi:hypothetical protein
MAQDFFAAFGHDGVGQIGSETTINSGDLAGILMIAVKALEKRTAELKQKEAQIAILESKVEELKAKHAYFETVLERLEALELRQNASFQIRAEKSAGDNLWQNEKIQRRSQNPALLPLSFPALVQDDELLRPGGHYGAEAYDAGKREDHIEAAYGDYQKCKEFGLFLAPLRKKLN